MTTHSGSVETPSTRLPPARRSTLGKEGEGVVFVCLEIPDNPSSTRYQRASLLVHNFRTAIIHRRGIADGIARLACQTSRVRGIFGWFALPVRLLRLKRSCQFSVIHTQQNLYAIVVGYLGKALFGFRWIYDLWDHPTLEFSLGKSNARRRVKAWLYSNLVGRLLCHADLWIVAMHDDVIKTLPACASRPPILKITNGVLDDLLAGPPDIDQQQARDPSVIRVCASGWMVPERGVGELILAARGVAKDLEGARMQLVLLGPTTAEGRAWLTREAQEPGRGVEIRYLGMVPHAGSIAAIEEADVAVCLLDERVLNYRYAYPIKLFEYLALGKVVVASAMPGVCEIMRDGHDGILVGPGSSGVEAGLERAFAVLRVGEAGTMGHAAMATAARYRWSTINRQVETAVRKVMEGLDVGGRDEPV